MQTVTAEQLPTLLTVDDGRGGLRALVQFVKNWNRAAPQDRLSMIAHAPDGPSAEDLARIAVVVRCLAERDGVPVPDWVFRHRMTPPVGLAGEDLESPFGRWVRANSPAVCDDHGVYFDPELLDR